VRILPTALASHNDFIAVAGFKLTHDQKGSADLLNTNFAALLSQLIIRIPSTSKNFLMQITLGKIIRKKIGQGLNILSTLIGRGY